MYLSTGLKAQMQRKMIVGSLLDKIPLPELWLPSSRSSSREPRFVDQSPRKWTAAPSGECRAGNPWFRRHPIRSHCSSHSTSRSATKIRCQDLFAANKEPPCQDSLKFELWMKKYETSIGSIENSQTLPTQDEKKDETCTNEYAWIWSFSQWLYPVLGHGGVCRLGRSLGKPGLRMLLSTADSVRRSPLTYDYGTWWLNTHLFNGTAIRQLSSQCPGVSQMSPEVLPPPVLQDVPLREHLPKSKWGREKKTWNGECVTPRTGYNSHRDIWYCGQLGFMVDVNTHPHCLAKGVLPYSFLVCYCCYCLKHSCRLPLIMIASHVAAAVAKALKSRRSMCCPAQSALQQAPCFHPWAQTAINWSNSVTDVTEATGGMEYQPSFTSSSRVGNRKHLRAGDFSRERLRRVLRKKAAVILHLHTFTSADLHLHTFTPADLDLHTLTPADLDLHTFTSADLDLHTLTSADLDLHTFTSADLDLHTFTPADLDLHTLTPADLDLHTFTSADLDLHTLTSADLDLHTFTPADLDLHTLTPADLDLHTLTSADLDLHTLTSADLHLHTLTSADLHLHPSRLQI